MIEYAHSFTNLKDIFGFDTDDEYRTWLKDKTSLPSGKVLIDELLQHAFDKHHIDKDKQDAIKEVFHASLTTDPTTGGLGKEWNELFFNSAQLYAQAHPQHSDHIVELDFSNMGGANNAIGREPVNRAVAIMAKIYNNELESTGASITTIRTGGDELRFYVSGANNEAIQTAITQAQEQIASFTQALGTNALEHTKYEKDPIRSGFGVGAASIELTPEATSAKDIQKALDDGIDAHKQSIGKARNITVPQLVSADTLRKHLSQKRVDSILTEWEKKLSIQTGTHKAQIPEILKLSHAVEDSYTARTEKAQQHASNWPDEATQLLLAGVDLFNAKDPTTGLKAPKALFEDLHYFKDVASCNKDNPPPMVTLFEVTNLRGLNKERDHETANQIIHDTVEHFTSALTKGLSKETNFKHRLYSLGASRFCLITTHTNEEQLQKSIQTAESYENNTQPILQRLQRLKTHSSEHAEVDITEIPSPTKVVHAPTGESTAEKGIMITHVTMPISGDKDISPKAQLQVLEDLSDIYAYRPESLQSQSTYYNPQRANLSFKFGLKTPWWVGNSKTNTEKAEGIPEDLARTALAGIRIPRESLPRIVAEIEPSQHIPSTNTLGAAATTTHELSKDLRRSRNHLG
jgi:GGDEF domain-containing protein